MPSTRRDRPRLSIGAGLICITVAFAAGWSAHKRVGSTPAPNLKSLNTRLTAVEEELRYTNRKIKDAGVIATQIWEEYTNGLPDWGIVEVPVLQPREALLARHHSVRWVPLDDLSGLRRAGTSSHADTLQGMQGEYACY